MRPPRTRRQRRVGEHRGRGREGRGANEGLIGSEHIEAIMGMEEGVQTLIVNAIQDLMNREGSPGPSEASGASNLSGAWMGPASFHPQMKTLLEQLESTSLAKEDMARRCNELDLQVNGRGSTRARGPLGARSLATRTAFSSPDRGPERGEGAPEGGEGDAGGASGGAGGGRRHWHAKLAQQGPPEAGGRAAGRAVQGGVG